MAWFSDAISEFKNLPPVGKGAVIVALIGVAGIGFYEYRKNATANSGTQPQALSNTSNGLPASSFGGVDLSSLATSIAGLINTQQPGSTSPPTTSGQTTGGTLVSGKVNPTGSTFTGPSGVLHYITTGKESLSQIASEFGLQSYNSIYAIPDNQKILGKLNSTSAKSYIPKSGTVITLPQGSTRKTGGGGMLHNNIPYNTLSLDDYKVQRYHIQGNGHLIAKSYKVSS